MDQDAKIEIPEIRYQGDDRKLKERVSKFKAGTCRIVVFTLVGLCMGFFSHTYVRDEFILTKVIMAVPYKISEAIYTSLIGTDAPTRYFEYLHRFNFYTEFFPHSMVATFLAETVTAVLIGGAVYGALAYFTGDRRVFTLQRFLKFAACWCAVILLTVGAAYAVNAKAVSDNENMKGNPVFFLYNSKGSGRGAYGAETESLMQEAFYSELREESIARSYEQELDLGICFSDFRVCTCRVNYEQQYVVTEQGKTYHISAEFAQMIREFEEQGILPGGGETESVEIRVISGEKEENQVNPGEGEENQAFSEESAEKQISIEADAEKSGEVTP